ncbi:MAG TPA: mercuric reductase [Myxococcales bacterium]|jgi:pyruvate/2-oxoglutarate dehydrogenase complex dihydrolipoamide dehydrogenase (E3) component
MDFDAIVIGSGQAGVPLANRLAAEGKRVLIAERQNLGGTCVNTGCTPTKTMIASAKAAQVARTAGRLGVHAKEVTVDFAAVVDRKNAIVGQWREGVSKRLKADRLTVARGHARFAGEKKVEVGGEVHSAETIVINVGARPNVPKLEGLDQVPWLDNARAMDLRELPSHLLVLGGGYIGCELGQMFRRFGARVSIVEGHDHLLANQDPEVSEALEKAFRKEEIDLHLRERVTRISGRAGDLAVHLESGKELRGSHLLVAVGRKPNTDDLACDRASVKLDERGSVIVDDNYVTSAPGIYAVGDVAGGPQFTHTSWDDHRLLFDILHGRTNHGRSGRSVPFTAFTDPQVAGVGLTEKEAKKRGVKYEVASMPFGNVARAVEVDETEGVMKLLLDPDSERVLGAAIVGAEAGELIHIFVTLMQAKASARAIVDAEFVHPTFAEGVQSLVMKLPRFALR